MTRRLRKRYGRTYLGRPGTRELVMRIYKRMPLGNRHLRGGEHFIMFTGRSADVYGAPNYTTVSLESLTDEELQRAARAVGVRV